MTEGHINEKGLEKLHRTKKKSCLQYLKFNDKVKIVN